MVRRSGRRGAPSSLPGNHDDDDQRRQRDVPVQARVLGLPDHAHPAFADLPDQAVVVELLSCLHVVRFGSDPIGGASLPHSRR